jgi:NAD(P)-dependent dehydrogenase (short-subunit alcohol dehydrogenase family)
MQINTFYSSAAFALALVTGCSSGIGFETMKALVANGAHVIGLGRTRDSARAACKAAGPSSTPIVCDLTELESVEAAADSILRLPGPLDAIITNAGIANLPTLQTRYGIELQFLVNHIAHFALVNRLADSVRSGTGRIVIVDSNPAGGKSAGCRHNRRVLVGLPNCPGQSAPGGCGSHQAPVGDF